MKSHIIAISLALFLWLICSPVNAGQVGPYSGQVVDAESGKPIEGSSVFISWTKLVAVDPKLLAQAAARGSVFEQPLLVRSDEVEARLLSTDRNGKYSLPSFSINTGSHGKIDSIVIIVYRPGWQAYIRHIRVDDEYSKPAADFVEKDNMVCLERVPANFDHGKHYETIERSLWEISGPYGDKAVPEQAELLRRVEWEERRSREDMEK